MCRGLPGVGAAGSSGSHNGIADVERCCFESFTFNVGKLNTPACEQTPGGANPAGPGCGSGPPALIYKYQLWNFLWDLHLKKHPPPPSVKLVFTLVWSGVGGGRPRRLPTRLASECQRSPRTLRVNRPVVTRLLHADSAFPLCASAAGLRCILHEHSVNLLIQNMSSPFLCLI